MRGDFFSLPTNIRDFIGDVERLVRYRCRIAPAFDIEKANRYMPAYKFVARIYPVSEPIQEQAFVHDDDWFNWPESVPVKLNHYAECDVIFETTRIVFDTTAGDKACARMIEDLYLRQRVKVAKEADDATSTE
jgi:hypothetical protein